MRIPGKKSAWAILAIAVVALRIMAPVASAQRAPAPKFHLEEATIAGIQQAIQTKQITTVQLVHLYLDRIKAYNGVCVDQPNGRLGFITPIPHAGQINALMTLNLRPGTRKATHRWEWPPSQVLGTADAGDTMLLSCASGAVCSSGAAPRDANVVLVK